MSNQQQQLSKKERKALKRQQANATVNTALAMIDGQEPTDVTPVQAMLALPESTDPNTQMDVVIVQPQGNGKQSKPSVKELMSQIVPPTYIDPSNYITAELADEMRILNPTPDQLEYLMVWHNDLITLYNEALGVNYQTAGYIVGLEADFDLEIMTRQNAQRQLAEKDKQIAKLKAELDQRTKDIEKLAIDSHDEFRRLNGTIKALNILRNVSVGVGAVGFVMAMGALIALSLIK